MAGVSWLNEPAAPPSAAPAAAAAPRAAARASVTSPGRDWGFIIRTAFRFSHVTLSVFMGACGFLTFGTIGGDIWNNGDSVFSAIFCFVIALMVFLFEFARVTGIKLCAAVYRANFGFLYSEVSKGLFLIFGAFILIGVKTSPDNALGITCAVLLMMDGALLVFTAMCYPRMLKGGDDEGEPAAAAQAAESEWTGVA